MKKQKFLKNYYEEDDDKRGLSGLEKLLCMLAGMGLGLFFYIIYLILG